VPVYKNSQSTSLAIKENNEYAKIIKSKVSPDLHTMFPKPAPTYLLPYCKSLRTSMVNQENQIQHGKISKTEKYSRQKDGVCFHMVS